ncbi:hypothetical protein BJ546DRAFT_1113171 [Cryomyces antarcticus]
MEDATAELQRQLREAQAELAKARHDRTTAEKRAEKAEERTRQTRFEEFLRECHLRLSKPLRIQTDKSLTTKGSITNPKDRPCPTEIKPWMEFPSLQQERFRILSGYLCHREGQFSSKQHLQELGQELCDRPFASEKDLEAYQRPAVERPISSIISALRRDEEACRGLVLNGDIVFENHANTLADGSEEVEERLQTLQLDSGSSTSKSHSTPKYSDQICVYKEADGTRTPCMVVEYKPAHKLVSAVLTQTYGYMLENGLEYSYVTTGEAFMFLWIRENEPHTLYYHLTEPNVEAGADTDESGIVLSSTAISQALCICTFALSSTPRNQQWRTETIESASKAAVDCKYILQQTPIEIKRSAPPTSEFLARLSKFKRSPILLRNWPQPRSNLTLQSCSPQDPNLLNNQSPSTSSGEASDIDTPSKSKGPQASRVASKARRPATKDRPNTKSTKPYNQDSYCTQRCLVGLVHGLSLDEACPNVSAHRLHKAGTDHSLSKISFKHAMKTQLAKSRDHGCEPLGKQGARGALFKLTLLSHGYTYVAKGTVHAFTEDLKHEASVYRRLRNVQGQLVPVYLGSLSLDRPYFLDFGVKIVRMLMMSWVGEQAKQDFTGKVSRWGLSLLDDKSNAAVNELRKRGVEHNDARPPNMLWNEENGCVMLVDFERSTFLEVSSVSKDILQTLAQWQYQHRDDSSSPLWTSAHRGVNCCGSDELDWVAEGSKLIA